MFVEPALEWLSSLNRQELYASFAVGLTFMIQAVRSRPRLRAALWSWVPDGSRWLLPMVAGAAIALAEGLTSGLRGWELLGTVAAGSGVLGLGSMGIHAALRDSPLHFNGGAGGKSRGRKEHRVTPVLLVLLALGCDPGAQYPEAGSCNGVTIVDLEVEYDSQLLRLKTSGKCAGYTAETCPALREIRETHQARQAAYAACEGSAPP
jgi:hypothetical protein